MFQSIFTMMILQSFLHVNVSKSLRETLNEYPKGDKEFLVLVIENKAI